MSFPLTLEWPIRLCLERSKAMLYWSSKCFNIPPAQTPAPKAYKFSQVMPAMTPLITIKFLFLNFPIAVTNTWQKGNLQEIDCGWWFEDKMHYGREGASQVAGLQYKLGRGLSHGPGSRGQEVVRLKISKPTLVTHLPSEALHHKDSIKIKKQHKRITCYSGTKCSNIQT